MEAEVPRPQVNIQEQMHYLELQKLTNSLCLASLEDEKYDVLRKLRFYTLTSDRIRTAAYQQQLPHLLLDEFIGTELSDKSKLINEYIQILASLALASTSSSGLPKLSKWEEACKKTISALKLNVNFYGIACAQFITNLIVRLTCGLERERISTFTLQIEAAFLSPRRGSDPTRSGPPLLDVECLKLFFTLINNQDGPTLETVCHLMFRLFTVAYDDRQQGDKCGFDRCTPILFIERKAMRELFSGQERRTIIMKQLSSFLQSELNVNNIVLSLHILSLIFSLIPRVEIREYLYHKLSTPTKIDIKDYFDSRVEGESPKDIVARIREANRKRFDDNHELTDIVLLDHLFMLTKSVQKSIIQLLSAMALCICMLRSRVISPVREIRASRLLIPCLCRLACVLCTEGDSEDVFNIPTMAMVLLLKIVPRHPRLEQVACYCDNLPKRLMEYLQSPRKKPANETDAESQEWSVIGGRCVFRTPISYDMQQWSRFFLCFDPCDHMILYAMPAIPLKRPWLDDRSFRSIVFQCIAALCSRLDRSRKRFLCDDRLLDLAIDAINSSFPPLKLSALLCYHVLSRSVCHIVRHLANDAMSQKVFSTLTKTLRKAAASEIELRRVYSMQPSSNPPPLDGRDRTGGCPVTLPESDLPYDDEDSSSEDSEQMRITQAVPIGTDMNTMLIRVTLSILANISAGMSPGCPRTFTEVVNNSETNEQIVRCVIQPSFLDDQSIEVITKLLQHVDTFVTRGAAWVLINLTYISDQQTMPLILRNLSVPAVQRMLNSSDIEVWEKAFGLIQNMMAYEAQEDVSNLKELARIAVAAIETQLRGVMTENDKKQQATICLLSSIASSFYSPMITNDLISLSLQHINTRNCQLSRLLVRCLNQMLNHNDPHVWKHRMCTETEAYNTIYGSLNGSFSKDYLLEAAEFIQKCGAIF